MLRKTALEASMRLVINTLCQPVRPKVQEGKQSISADDPVWRVKRKRCWSLGDGLSSEPCRLGRDVAHHTSRYLQPYDLCMSLNNAASIKSQGELHNSVNRGTPSDIRERIVELPILYPPQTPHSISRV